MSFFFRHIPTVEVNFSVQGTAEVAGEDALFVSEDIWEKLCFGESRRVVSIKSRHGSLSDRAGALTCWAVCRPNVSEVTIPPVWLATYPAIFRPFQMCYDGPPKSLIISPVGNVSLTEVVLTAKDENAYVAASTHGGSLEEWLFESQVIIRDGEEISIPQNAFSTATLQHSIPLFTYTVNLALPYKQGIAQREFTRFVVTLPSESSTDKADTCIGHENFEINESFLVSAILSSPEPLSQELDDARLSEAVFSVDILRSPIDDDLDHVTVYICAGSLHPLGLLNGDWALASPIDSSTSRLVRIGALDALSVPSRRSAVLSPILLHNLCPRGCEQIVIRTTLNGARTPGIPTARSITLARVPSPFSIHRRHEQLFIDALQQYFRSSKRLVKDGDMIPLRVNVDRSLDPHHILCPEDFTGSTAVNTSIVAIHFVVRNVEYDFSTIQTRGQRFPSPNVGCFVDANVTKIVQTGVEHAKVPDVYDYYDLRRAQGTLPAAFGISRQISQLSNAMSLDEAASLGVRSTVFLTGSRGTGKFAAATRIAGHLRMHLVEINCFDVLSDTTVKTEVSLQEQVTSALSCSPCLIVLRHADALSHSTTTTDGKEPSVLQKVQMYINEADKSEGQQCILVGIVEKGNIPEGISYSNEIEIKALSEEERLYLLSEQVGSWDKCVAPDVSLSILAKQTAAFVVMDLVNLVNATRLCAAMDFDMCQLIGQPVMSIKQFDAALIKARKTLTQSIGAPTIPKVLWKDVGGLNSVKHDILDTVQLPLDHPELFQDGLKKRSGVLLYGPPGTGKTLLAKAVATSCSLNFFSVKGPELLNMYIGESEANVRRIFQRARDAKPCVIFFDELDSIAPKRGNQGDSGGVMDCLVSQLLAELDGMSQGGMDVFVIGATNRPDLLDPALLRPGRFDRLLYLGVSETHEAQLDILKALTHKFNLHPGLNLALIAAQCPFNYTGADFYALCADALLHALSCKVVELEEERAQLNALSKYMQHAISPQFFITEIKTEAELQLVVKKEDFDYALEELIPSISPSELLHYASIQKNW